MPEYVINPHDHQWSGNHLFTGTMSLPPNSIDENDVKAAANFPHTNVTHRINVTERHNSTEESFATSHIMHMAYRNETVLGVEAVMFTAPGVTSTSTAGFRTSIDMIKSTGGSTGSSILSTPLVFSSTDSSRVPKAATLSGTPTLKDGNILYQKTAVSGATGTQGQGLCIEIILAQKPFNT